MSDIGKVRIRVPSSIKPGDVVRVRTLVIHPMERIERDLMGQALERAGGIQSRAAQLLGTSFRSFRYRLQKYGLADAPDQTA